jgi:L-asparaginase II
MAATAAYVAITRIPLDGLAKDGHSEANINATGSAFTLKGGTYGVTCKASTYGTVALSILCADGATYVAAMTAFSADGYAQVNLPPGTYKVTLA